MFAAGSEDVQRSYEHDHPVAGNGWMQVGSATIGIVERVDDYCATAFVYALAPQPVPRVDVATATVDLARASFESPDPMEQFLP
jgi:hypothetical protein